MDEKQVHIVQHKDGSNAPPAVVLNQPPNPDPPRFTWQNLLWGGLIIGLLGWGSWERFQRSQQPEPLIVALADITAPTASFSDAFPSAADAAIMSLARGDCLSAAAAFRTARRGHSDMARLWVLEGASFVCAGQPDDARPVLEQILGTDNPPRQGWWYLAQACLLQGDAECAHDALERSIAVDSRHRRQAEIQRMNIQNLR